MSDAEQGDYLVGSYDGSVLRRTVLKLYDAPRSGNLITIVQSDDDGWVSYPDTDLPVLWSSHATQPLVRRTREQAHRELVAYRAYLRQDGGAQP